MFILFSFFETRSHCIAQAGHKHGILLLQLPGTGTIGVFGLSNTTDGLFPLVPITLRTRALMSTVILVHPLLRPPSDFFFFSTEHACVACWFSWKPGIGGAVGCVHN